MPSRGHEPGLLLGEFVHNARGALDALTWQLAIAHLEREPTEREARSIQFPISKREENFASSKVLPFISEEAGARIEGYQPYKAVDVDRDSLFVLSWLSNRDKHRLVHPSPISAPLAYLRFTTRARDVSIRRSNFGYVGHKGNAGAAVQKLFIDSPHYVPAEVEVEVHGQPPADVFFGGPVDNLDLADLRRVIARVHEVLADVGLLLV
jgi:hypothetical protein